MARESGNKQKGQKNQRSQKNTANHQSGSQNQQNRPGNMSAHEHDRELERDEEREHHA
jgi:hypothetical protein